MSQQPLPGASTVLAMGIISIVSSLTCCGPLGIVFALIALNKAKEAQKLYQQNPESYTDYSNVATGKTLSYVGLVLSIIFLLVLIVYLIIYFGFIVAMLSSVDWENEVLISYFANKL